MRFRSEAQRRAVFAQMGGARRGGGTRGGGTRRRKSPFHAITGQERAALYAVAGMSAAVIGGYAGYGARKGLDIITPKIGTKGLARVMDPSYVAKSSVRTSRIFKAANEMYPKDWLNKRGGFMVAGTHAPSPGALDIENARKMKIPGIESAPPHAKRALILPVESKKYRNIPHEIAVQKAGVKGFTGTGLKTVRPVPKKIHPAAMAHELGHLRPGNLSPKLTGTQKPGTRPGYTLLKEEAIASWKGLKMWKKAGGGTLEYIRAIGPAQSTYVLNSQILPYATGAGVTGGMMGVYHKGLQKYPHKKRSKYRSRGGIFK